MQLRDRTFVLIDTETTGFNKDKHQLLEIGMLVIKDLKVIDELEIKIKHKEYVITAGAMSANKIDIISHDSEGIETKKACDEILAFLKKYVEVIDGKHQGLIPIGQNIEGKIDLEKQDLDTLLNTLGIEIPDNRHRAITDCYLELEVLNKLLNL